ncbi:MAG: DNA recombination protein RmuC, partial [Mucinivorans sp.]
SAQEIVRRGNLMYEKFVTFSETFLEVGRYMERSRQSYDQALGQLSGGPGNLIRQAQTLRSMGLKSSKELPEKLAEQERDE